MKASIRLDHSLVAVESEHHLHAMIELTAPPAPAGGERPQLNLALVLDRSGSMDGDKLEVTKRCAAFLVDRLAPGDKLALITFDDEVELLAPLDNVDKQMLFSLIASIESGGSTNLSGGWLKGMEELKRDPSGISKLILLTDGEANVGVVEPVALSQMARVHHGAGRGTTTIGFGDGFDEDLLTAMSDAGGGNSYFAATPDDAPGIFNEEFEGLVSIVAQNVSVEIRPSDEVELLSVLNEYPSVAVPGGVQIQIGDAYGDECRRILFALQVPEIASLGPAKIADVVVRSVLVGETIEEHETTIPIIVNAVNSDDAAKAVPDAGVVEEVLILRTAKAQEEARGLLDDGDFDGAKNILGLAAFDLRRLAPQSDKADDLLREADIIAETVASIEEGTYGPADRKAMSYNVHNQRRRRSR